MSIVQTKALSITYDTRDGVLHAVNDVTISVEAGEAVGVVGDSGCGKSTLLLGLLGMARPGGRIVSGSVRFGNTELVGASGKTLAQIRSKRVGFIPQSAKAAMNPLMSVGDHLIASLRERGTIQSRREAFAMGSELLRAVGIADPERRWRSYPHELSGGMAQRVLIAVALVGEPEVIFADEPTSGLDVTLQAQILDDLRHVVDEARLSLVIVTHDTGVVAHYTDRVYVMNAGEVIEECPTAVLFSRPRSPVGLALVSAAYDDESSRVRLTGLPVDRRQLPLGCYLGPRCPFASDAAACRSKHPALVELDEGHRVRCHRHAELPELEPRRAARSA